MKAFPASVLGTDWFAAVQAPFPQVRLVATGGMTTESIPQFLAAGARVVSLGSALQDARQLAALVRHVQP